MALRDEHLDDRVIARELQLLMPLAREAWPLATDTWRLSLMQLAVQVFEFQQPRTGEHAPALIALEAAMLSLARSHKEARGQPPG